MEAPEFDATLKDLETRLDRLKALYEMYFQGIERIEPSVPRKQVERLFELLRRDQPRSTHLRFRYQSLLQRYTTLQTYWRRVTRQIEEGTYKRDLQKLKRKDATRDARSKREDGAEKGVYELDVDVDLDTEDLSSLLNDPELEAAFANLELGGPPSSSPASAPAAAAPKVATFGKPTERRRRSGDDAAPAAPAAQPAPAPTQAAPPRAPVPTPSPAQRPPVPTPAPAQRPPAPTPPPIQRAAPPPPPGAAPPAAPRPASAGPDEARMKRIYDDYVTARKNNNERVDNVKYESLQRSIEDMIPKLKEKHQGKAIDFEVVVRDGRVGLKPVTK